MMKMYYKKFTYASLFFIAISHSAHASENGKIGFERGGYLLVDETIGEVFEDPGLLNPRTVFDIIQRQPDFWPGFSLGPVASSIPTSVKMPVAFPGVVAKSADEMFSVPLAINLEIDISNQIIAGNPDKVDEKIFALSSSVEIFYSPALALNSGITLKSRWDEYPHSLSVTNPVSPRKIFISSHETLKGKYICWSIGSLEELRKMSEVYLDLKLPHEEKEIVDFHIICVALVADEPEKEQPEKEPGAPLSSNGPEKEASQ